MLNLKVIKPASKVTLFKPLFFFILGFLVCYFASFVFGTSKNIKFVDFPETRQGEMGLPAEFNLDSKAVNELIKTGKTQSKKNLYALTKSQTLDSELTAYGVEIKDITKLNDKDAFPLVEGVIILNKNINKAVQLYDASIWLYTLGLPDGPSSGFYLTDINNDGTKEFVIQSFTGGNSLASVRSYIFQADKTEGFKLLNPMLDSRFNITSIKDLNNDGKYELVIADDTWEITSCTDHSSGPITYYVYGWDGSKYTDSSINFPDFYQKIINDSTLMTNCGAKDRCFGPALNRYFAYKQIGKEKEGWNKFLETTKGLQNGAWPSKTCFDYIVGLHNSGKNLTPPQGTINDLIKTN